jgi:hypothetical protein
VPTALSVFNLSQTFPSFGNITSTTWSRILLQMLTVVELVYYFPPFMGPLMLITKFTKAGHCPKSIKFSPYHMSLISMLILSSQLHEVPILVSFFRIFQSNFVCTSQLSCVSHAAQSYSSYFDHPNLRKYKL